MGHVFISSSAQTNQDRRFLRPAAGVTEHPGKGVRSFQRGDDPSSPADCLKCIQRLVVGGRLVAHPPAVFEPAVFRSDSGIVQPGGNRVGRQHLAIFILQQIAQASMQDARLPGRESGTVVSGPNSLPPGFDPYQLDFRVIHEAGEEADCIGSSPYAGHGGGRKPAIALQHLAPGLATDD